MPTASEHWLRRAVIYSILVDRFAGFAASRAGDWDLPVFIGGNLGTITSKLDYLVELGINTLWLSPIYRGVDYHGYHITDFRAVDSRFGNLGDLKSLIEQCRRRGLRVIADLVPNHCHESHPFFQEALRNKKSPYRQWFNFDKQDRYATFLGCAWLPKLNLENSQARRYMIDSALYWQDLGLDGFRIDHVIGVSHGFLQDLSIALKKANPESVLFGEAVMDTAGLRKHHKTFFLKDSVRRRRTGLSQESMQKDYRGVIDGVLDFAFHRLLVRHVRGRLPAPSLNAAIQRHFAGYPSDFSLVLFLDNHDMNRLFCECLRRHGDRSKAIDALKAAFLIMMKCARHYRHPVAIYYGDEILLNQVAPMQDHFPHQDLLVRRTMSWSPDSTQIAFYAFVSKHLKELHPQTRPDDPR